MEWWNLRQGGKWHRSPSDCITWILRKSGGFKPFVGTVNSRFHIQHDLPDHEVLFLSDATQGETKKSERILVLKIHMIGEQQLHRFKLMERTLVVINAKPPRPNPRALLHVPSITLAVRLNTENPLTSTGCSIARMAPAGCNGESSFTYRRRHSQ